MFLWAPSKIRRTSTDWPIFSSICFLWVRRASFYTRFYIFWSDLTQGTKKYPDVDYFGSFVSSNGGYTNAYTDSSNTLYYFTIENSKFAKGLDIFSEFFSHPLLDFKYVQKEMNAVNSEFDKNKNSDVWREWNRFSFSSNPESIFHSFSSGNLQTLDIPNIYDRLLEFYNSNYRLDFVLL